MTILTRKLQFVPVGDNAEKDRVYQYLRDAIYAQNKAYNILYSRVYSAVIGHEGPDAIKEIWKRGSRMPSEEDPEWSLYDFADVRFATGLDQPGALSRQARLRFEKQVKEGLLKGKVALESRKLDAPVWIKTHFSFYHKYETHEAFLEKLFTSELEVFVKFVNNIHFRVFFGNPRKSEMIRKEICNVLEGNYTIHGSSIQFDRTGKKIILNLCMGVPEKKIKLRDDITVGVDLGLAVPAVCATNTGSGREFIGCAEEFLRMRTKLKAERRRIMENIKFCSGGHGKTDKLRHLSVLDRRETNFVSTYNHMVSKRVVDFAVKHKAAYINLEDLSDFHCRNFIMQNWSFYRLQQNIIYKAAAYGIKVRKIDPRYTSQTCSFCHHREEGQRISQGEFRCKNPSCRMFGKAVNADWNAARNIANSTEFV